jgi:hypothetical protein
VLGAGDRGQRGDQRVERDRVEALHHGPPARQRRPPVQRRQHPSARRQLVRQRGDRAHVPYRRSVAHLLGRVLQLGRLDGQRRDRPRPQRDGTAAGVRRAGPDQLGRRQRAAAAGGQEQRDRGRLAGVDPREGRGRRGERVRGGGAQRSAAAARRPLAVLGPQQQALAGGPQGVDGEHAARLRATRDSSAGVQEDRAWVVVITTVDARSC